MAQDVVRTGYEAEFGAVIERLVLAKKRVQADLARAFGLPDPFVSDADRVALLKARALPPERCGSDMIAAPARGPMVAFSPLLVTPKDKDWDVRHVGFKGRDAARMADAFDLMDRQARRKGGDEYRPPFSDRQMGMGRRYAALVEKHNAAGVRGISIETMLAGRAGGSATGSSYMDALIQEGRCIQALRAAIGDDVALVPKRAGSSGRSGITVRVLVDLVCIEGLTISQVLRRFGWVPDKVTRPALQSQLGAALDRMWIAE
ncbi:hypothetical protein [Paenirhodobacter populi]|uniref:Uncharacterized protein n=1 Tax=Paenirhodobacter populi TaxID=2306993 RepID=A0A443JE70_9RHOB|nr:hypothetical protein [Sinirhodobacter populi]RWR18812.1 hypothetical protein D2T30_15745 [Sinirhodobacter populi]